MSIVGLGLLLLLIGVVVWLLVSTGAGVALIVIGAVVAVIGLVVDRRGRL